MQRAEAELEKKEGEKRKERRSFANLLIKEIVKEYDSFSKELEQMLQKMKDESQRSKE